MGSEKEQIRLAILGCGAITRNAHLPAALAQPRVRVAALVDADVKRAQVLAANCGLQCTVVDDARQILSGVDAVVVAVPNHLHVSASLDALRAGVHVLCEKPLAITTAGARGLCEAAAEKSLVLAVGMNRRFESSTRLLRLLLQDGVLGELNGYEWEYGAAYDWGTASGFYFNRAQAGGGVLLDHGVHLLDSAIDWFGDVTHFEYQDDNWGGGIEANAILDICHSGAFGEVPGRIRLSRTFNLKNRLLIRGTRACAEIAAADQSSVLLHNRVHGEEVQMTVRLASAPLEGTSFSRQLDNFVQSIRGRDKPVVDGWQAMRVLVLVERCYQQARRIPEPWSQFSPVSVGIGV